MKSNPDITQIKKNGQLHDVSENVLYWACAKLILDEFWKKLSEVISNHYKPANPEVSEIYIWGKNVSYSVLNVVVLLDFNHQILPR